MTYFFSRNKAILSLLFGAIFLFAPISMNAAEALYGYTWAVGETVTITAPITGDLFVAANTLKIEAPVAGDVFAVASTIVIDGEVQGSVRVAAQTLLVRKSIGGSLAVWGGAVHAVKGVSIGRYLWADVQTLDLQGTVQGDLIYHGPVPPSITTDAHIGGKTIATVRPQPSAWQAVQSPVFIFRTLIALFGLYIVGLVCIMLNRRPTAAVMSAMMQRPWQSLGLGAAVAITTPIIAVVLAVTLIGIPLALILLVLWALFLYIAHVFAALTIGFVIMQRADTGHRLQSFLWTLVVGGLVWTVLILVPYVGWTIRVFGVLWALGAIVMVKKQILVELNAAPVSERPQHENIKT